jgi:hypothetical protein
MINDFLVAGEDGDNWRFLPETLQALVESYGGDRVSGLPLLSWGSRSGWPSPVHLSLDRSQAAK